MIAWILHRRRSDERKCLPPIEGQLMYAPLSLPNTEGSAGEEPLISPETSCQQDKQSDPSQHETEPWTNRATSEIQVIEKRLREKERHLQIREADVQDVEEVLQVKERHLQIREADVQDVEKVQQEKESHLRIREAEVQDFEKVLGAKERDLQIREAKVQDVEKVVRVKQVRGAEVQDVEKVLRMKERDLQLRAAEVQKMLQAVNERSEATGLQEDNLRQRLAAMKEWEEDLRLREAALTQIARQPNDAARDSDLFSLSSISTIRNSPRVRSNVDLSPQSSARLTQDSRYHGNELAPTARGGPSKYTNIGLSSSKSHARLKDDSEYYSNE